MEIIKNPTENQQTAKKIVERIAYEHNTELVEELQIEIEDLYFVGNNSVAFDVKTKSIHEYDTNCHMDNNDEIHEFIKDILTIFERVRISQDFEVGDLEIYDKIHISCGITRMWWIGELEEGD